MERKRVNSSKLRSVGYDEMTRTLEIEMSNGQVFQYSGVYPEVYRRLMNAPSTASRNQRMNPPFLPASLRRQTRFAAYSSAILSSKKEVGFGAAMKRR